MAGNNNRYSDAEMRSMRQDAIRRTQEMHQRAHGMHRPAQPRPSNSNSNQHTPHTSGGTPSSPQHTAQSTSQENTNTASPQQTPAAQNTASPSSLTALFERLGLDGERAILLLIIFLLVKDGADSKLILALCYLLI